MWKSGAKPHECLVLSVNKIVNSFSVFHSVCNLLFMNITLLTFQQKNVDKYYSRSLELMLDVISRTTMPVC